MQKPLAFLVFSGVLVSAVWAAAFEITAEAMRDIEDTFKSFDSNVALKDTPPAVAQAKELVAFFRQVEGHYQQKGNAADAVGYAHTAQEQASLALAALVAQNFDAAGEAVSGLARSCKACHDVYKNK